MMAVESDRVPRRRNPAQPSVGGPPDASPPPARDLHDSIVAAAARNYEEWARKNGYVVTANPGNVNPRGVGPKERPRFPDIVVWDAATGEPLLIEEIEAHEDLGAEDAARWQEMDALHVAVFNIVVPKEQVEAAMQLVDRFHVHATHVLFYVGPPEKPVFHVYS